MNGIDLRRSTLAGAKMYWRVRGSKALVDEVSAAA
jgi:hypothetical protein